MSAGQRRRVGEVRAQRLCRARRVAAPEQRLTRVRFSAQPEPFLKVKVKTYPKRLHNPYTPAINPP